MIYTKSELGLQAMKDRHVVDLSRAQRSVLILFDGHRSLRAVLEATAPLGVTSADVDRLLQLGLLQRADGEAATPGEPATVAAPGAAQAEPAALSEDERAQRYRVAYPLATQITAQLGLRGFALNLAVEAAQGFDGLVALLPRLRAAVGDEALQQLEDALNGR